MPSTLKNRLLVAVVTFAGLLVLALGTAAADGAEAPGNLALHAACEVVEGGSLWSQGCAAVIDGNSATAWRAYQQGLPETLSAAVRIDLGAVHPVSTVVIYEYGQNAVDLAIKVSVDGVDWSVAATRHLGAAGAGDRRIEIVLDDPLARYIEVEAKDAKYAFGIYEFEVYEKGTGAMHEANRMQELGEPQVVADLPFAKGDFHIYLFIGQSNMAGRAPIESQEMTVLERSFVLNKSDEWEPAQPWRLPESKFKDVQGLNRYSTVEVLSKVNGLNPAFYFAKTLVANVPDVGVGIVSNAKGNTALREWVPGSELYQEAVRRAREAMKYGVLKAVIWHQGESDRSNQSYVEQLATLIKRLRQDLGIEDLPFIAGELLTTGDAQKRQASQAFNARLSRLPAVAAFTGVASAEGIGDIGDGTHIDAHGQRLLGQRYALIALDLVYGMDRDEIKTPLVDRALSSAR